MLKKILNLVLAVVLFSYTNVFASGCSYKEQADLNSEASNIKAVYEVKKELMDPSEYECYNPDGCEDYYEYFQITLLNVSNNFDIKVTNNLNDEELYLSKYDFDEDEEMYFYWSGIYNITTFTFEAITTSETACMDDTYKIFHLTTPRKNRYSTYGMCNDKDSYLCDEYVTFKDMGASEFEEKLNDKNTPKEDPNIVEEEVSLVDTIFAFLDNYKLYFIIGSASVAIIIIVIATVSDKKRRLL